MKQLSNPNQHRTAAQRRARGMAAVAAAALLLAAVPASAQDAQEPMRVTRTVNATEDNKAPTRQYSSPYVLIHPDDPTTAIAATVDMAARTCHVLRSGDAGHTWEMLDASPSPASHPFCFQTSGMVNLSPMAWGRDASVYLAAVGWGPEDQTEEHTGGRGNVSVVVSRSDDLGETWEATLARNTRGFEGAQVENNRPVTSIAVDATSGDEDIVYVTWDRGLPAVEDAPNEPMLAVSTDGAETFSEPVSLFGDYERGSGEDMLGLDFGAKSFLAVDDEGTLYALFGASGGDAEPVLLLAKSTDQGQTFEVSEIDTMSPSFSYPAFKWSPQGGEQGTLHLVYEDKLGGEGLGDRDVFYRQSTDGGSTWSEPQMLNDDDPEQLAGQFNANVSVADNGRIDVAWWDFRDDPGLFANDVYATYSTDNGATWAPNVRVSDQSIRRTIGLWSNGFDMRQPPGVASAEDYALFAWDDTRLGDDVGQAQDVFSAAVQFEPVAATEPAGTRLALAGLVGLLVGGIFLLGSALRMRAAPPRQPPARKPPARTPA